MSQKSKIIEDNMKIYIFFMYGIINFGGGQNYVKHKKEFLEQNGFKVLVISSACGKILIPEFRQYEEWINPVITYHPAYFADKEKIKFFQKIQAYCESSDDIIIESCDVVSALWGELFAKLLNAKHICYILSEKPRLRKCDIQFLEFKLRRKELSGITNKTLAQLFRNVRELKDEEKYWLSAGGTIDNIVQDFKFPLIDNISVSDYCIGNIGRLAKPYVIPMCEQVALFANTIPDKKITFILIGGSASGRIEKEIYKKFQRIKNVNVIITGYMPKIPKRFFDILDVGIASAGSASLLWEQRVATISLDGNDSLPIGVLGYTTQNQLFRDESAQFTLCELLRKIFCEHYLEDRLFTERPKIRTDAIYKQHLLFVEQSCQIREYFDTSMVPNSLVSKILLCTKPFNIFLLALFVRLRPMLPKSVVGICKKVLEYE